MKYRRMRCTTPPGSPFLPVRTGSSRWSRWLCVALTFGALGAVVAPAAEARANPPFRGYLTAHTRHFIFVYEPSDQAAVDELLSVAEDVYQRVTSVFHSYPPIVRCLVIGRTDEANGDFNPLPPFHLELFVASPTTPEFGATDSGWMRTLLTHEFTHFVQFDYDRGVFADLARLFGPEAAVLDAAFLPGWYYEGLAVSDETRFTSGGRGNNPYFLLIARGLLLDHAMWPYGEISYDPLRPPYGRVYFGGYLLVDDLIRTFGPDIVQSIEDRFVGMPFAGILPPIRQATGETAGANYDGMARRLAMEYADAAALPSGKRISPPVVGNYSLPIVTEGGWITYRTEPNRRPAVVGLWSDGEAGRVIFTASLSDPWSFSADRDGTLVAFASYVVDGTVPASRFAGGQVISDLYLHDVASGKTRRLTVDEHLVQPALSPDGRRLVALQRSGSYRDLVAVDIRTGKVTALWSPPSTRMFNPVWSPDGSRIAVVASHAGDQGIYLVDSRTGTAARLRFEPGPPVGGNGARESAVDEAAVNTRTPVVPFLPHFTDDSDLTFSAQWKGNLILMGANLRSGLFGRVAADRVGIADAVIPAGGTSIIYTTYSADGFVIREQPAPPRDSIAPLGSVTLEPVEDSPGGVASDARVSPASDPKHRNPESGIAYADPPVTTWWAPIPEVTRNAAGILNVGAGAATGGSSLAGTWNWLLEAGLLPTLLQPTLNATLTWQRGGVSLGSEFSEGYGPQGAGGGVGEQFGETISATVTPFAIQDFRGTRELALDASFGATVSLSRQQTGSVPTDFNFAQGFDPVGRSIGYRFPAEIGFSYSFYGLGSAIDIYPRRDITFSATALTSFPVLDLFGGTTSGTASGSTSSTGLDLQLNSTFGLAIPVPGPAASLRLVVRTGVDTSVGPTSSSTSPAGFAGISLTAPIVADASLAYRITVGRFDLPLPLGFGLTGLATSVFLDYGAQLNPPGWSAAAQGSGAATWLVPDNRVTFGVEMAILLGIYTIQVPMVVGADVRIDPTFAQNPRFPADFGLYVSVNGINLFSSATTRPGAMTQEVQIGAWRLK